jgi:hypothetical protein
MAHGFRQTSLEAEKAHQTHHQPAWQGVITMKHVSIESMVERWTSLKRPLFRGQLIDHDGCKCAQGDVLFCAGYTDEQLRGMAQSKADAETARVLGISRTHAVLLRNVNDKQGGCPQLVLSHPEKVLGDKAQILLAFWLHLEGLSDATWAATWDATCVTARVTARATALATARAATWATARDAARAATWDETWDETLDETWDAARAATADASSEIQGMDILEKAGRKPYFLAMFGLDTWDKVRALTETK